MDKNKLIYDLSLTYAQEILKSRPEDIDCIPEMNNLLLKAFKDAYTFYNGLSDSEFEFFK